MFMDPKIIGYALFLMLIFPGFYGQIKGQVNDIRAVLSDLGSYQGIYDLGLILPGEKPELRTDPEIQFRVELTDTIRNISVPSKPGLLLCNPSLLLMVRGLLSKQEVLLDYFPSDTSIRIMVITKESARIYVAPVCSGFWRDFKLLLGRIRMADLFDYRKQSQCFSKVLLETISEELNSKSRAIIIAHEDLSGFPFEVLLYQGSVKSSAHKNKLLVESWEIIYNNSIEQWLYARINALLCNTKSKADNSLAFAGFSPGFEYHDCIQELPHTGSEISTIGEMFRKKGKNPLVLLCENSNENNFKAIAPFSQIIHIATHTLISKELPELNGLLFNEFGSERDNNYIDDGLLAVNEIRTLKIPAELIVLDACASANLRSRIGFNWFSFTDSFMKAGARNILGTLWNVNDRFAELFMVEFYRNYLAGVSFSKALQRVKIKMMKDPSTSLPVNWAAYVLIGE